MLLNELNEVGDFFVSIINANMRRGCLRVGKEGEGGRGCNILLMIDHMMQTQVSGLQLGKTYHIPLL